MRMLDSKPCPASYIDSYCLNGGECLAEYSDDPGDKYFLPYCKCATGYHGRQCEYLFNSEIYGFNVGNKETQLLAVSTLATVIILILVLCCCCLYLCWKFGRDRSDYSPRSTVMSTSYRRLELVTQFDDETP